MCIVNEVIRRVDKKMRYRISEWRILLLILYFVMIALVNPSSLLSISWEVQHSTAQTAPQVTPNTLCTGCIIKSKFQNSAESRGQLSMGQKSKVSYTDFEVLIKTRLYTFNPNNFATLLINLAGCPIRLQSRTYLCTFTARAQWLKWLLY